jgi:cytochrome c oxidase cbb3-type subunit 4
MTHEGLVEFAKTWGLVYLAILFIGVLVYAFWPGSKKKFERYGQIPLEED